MVFAASYGMSSITCGWVSHKCCSGKCKVDYRSNEEFELQLQTTTMSGCARAAHFPHDALGPAGERAEPAVVKETNQWNYVKMTETSSGSCDTTH